MNKKSNNVDYFIKTIIRFFSKEPIIPKLKDLEFERSIRNISNQFLTQDIDKLSLYFDLVIDNRIESINQLDIYIKNIKEKKKKNKFDNEILEFYRYSLSNEIYNTIFEQRIYINSFTSKIFDVFLNKSVNDINLDRDSVIETFDFDLFLSHRHVLKFLNYLLFYTLTVYEGILVYVDWIFDHQVDRNKLSKNTVNLLKKRMMQSKKFMFFNLTSVKTTNWMAWEVGYFTCKKSDSVGIFDLLNYCKGNKNVEVLSSDALVTIKDNEFIVNGFKGSLFEWTHSK